jgi:uncharacterized delta-60 repeat protein
MRNGGVTMRSFLRYAVLSAVGAAVLLIVSTAQAAPGAIDPSFGTNGRVRINAPVYPYSEYNGPLLIERDGSIVLAGRCETTPVGTNTTLRGACLARVLVDGAPDPTFGTNGLAIGTVNGSDELYTGLARQSDGKYVLSDHCRDADGKIFCARRFTATGGVDSTFSVANLARPAGSSAARADAIAVDHSGRLMMMGQCQFGIETRLCVLRLLPNGQPDPSYGPDGFVIVSLQPAVLGLYGRIEPSRLPNGKMQFAMLCDLVAGLHYCIAQLTADGVLDTTFNNAGVLPGLALKVRTVDYNVEVAALVRRSDGSTIVAAKCTRYSPSNGPDELCLVSFTADGRVDISFGNAGERRVTPDPITGTQIPNNVLAMPDGRLVIAAGCSASPYIGSSTCVNRYLADGSLDASFTSTELNVTPRPGYDTNSLGTQASGKIIIGGSCKAVAFDTAFVPGFCITRIEGGPFDYAQCSADIDGDGEITVKDSLLLSRAALGFRGNAVTQNVSFNTLSTRTNWPAIRDYLFNDCGMQVTP